MNVFKKVLATAVMCTTAGTAGAAITKTSPGPGEIFLSVYDPTAELSYSLDLGITTAEFLVNPTQSLSYDLSGDANYAPFLSSANAMVFTITGGDQTLNDLADFNDFGIVFTSNQDASTSPFGDFTGLQNAAAKFDNYVTELNSKAGDNVNEAANNSSQSAAGQPGYHGGPLWGSNAAGGVPLNMEGSVGGSVNFWWWGASDLDGTVVESQMPSQWALSTSGLLTYGSASAVPVPAAVWLFGSGLLGLAGVARRKRA